MPEQATTCACGCGLPHRPGRRYHARHSAERPWRARTACSVCGGSPYTWALNGCADAFHEASRERRRETIQRARDASVERRAAYARRRWFEDPAYRAQTRIRAAQWDVNHRDRSLMSRRAAMAVCRAVKRGLLIRSDTCEQCGSVGRKIEAAHHDYSRPLDVRWLCKPCHARWDRREPKTLHAEHR
jgi:hypothetical protein